MSPGTFLRLLVNYLQIQQYKNRTQFKKYWNPSPAVQGFIDGTGIYSEVAGDAVYFTPLLALRVIKLQHGEASELFDEEVLCGERSTESRILKLMWLSLCTELLQ